MSRRHESFAIPVSSPQMHRLHICLNCDNLHSPWPAAPPLCRESAHSSTRVYFLVVALCPRRCIFVAHPRNLPGIAALCSGALSSIHTGTCKLPGVSVRDIFSQHGFKCRLVSLLKGPCRIHEQGGVMQPRESRPTSLVEFCILPPS